MFNILSWNGLCLPRPGKGLGTKMAAVSVLCLAHPSKLHQVIIFLLNTSIFGWFVRMPLHICFTLPKGNQIFRNSNRGRKNFCREASMFGYIPPTQKKVWEASALTASECYLSCRGGCEWRLTGNRDCRLYTRAAHECHGSSRHWSPNTCRICSGPKDQMDG